MMDTFISVIFDTGAAASDGLHALQMLGGEGEITVRSTAVVRCDVSGRLHVVAKNTDAGRRAVVGTAVGALVGMLAGPAGVAAGAVIGGAIGGTADMSRSGDREEAATETRSLLQPGQYALIAEIDEKTPSAVDAMMKELGGTVYRRDAESMNAMATWGTDGEGPF